MRLADLFSASLDAGLYYALSGLVHTTRLTRGFDLCMAGRGGQLFRRRLFSYVSPTGRVCRTPYAIVLCVQVNMAQWMCLVRCMTPGWVIHLMNSLRG